MNERDLNLDRMREAVLKLEVTQFAKVEAQLAKDELREDLKQQATTLRGEIHNERRAFYAKVGFVAAIIIGGDIWTMYGVYRNAQRVVAETLQRETKAIQNQVAAVRDDLAEAQRTAAETQAKAATASKLVEESIQELVSERDSLTAQIGVVSKQLTNARTVNTDLDSVKKDVQATSAALKTQQRQLSDTSELVKMLFSKGQTEQFEAATNTNRLLVLPVANRQYLETIKTSRSSSPLQAYVFIVLKDAPIPQTLQLQWFVYAQPRTAYNLVDGTNNVIVFRWGQSVDGVKERYLEANYIADKSATPTVKVVSIKNGLPFGDDKPLVLDGFSRFLLTPTEAPPPKK